MDREKDGIRNFEPATRLVRAKLGEARSGNGRKNANSGLSQDAGRQFETFGSRVPQVHRLQGTMCEIHRLYGLWVIGGSSYCAGRGSFSDCPWRYFEFYSLSHLVKGKGILALPEKPEQAVLPGDAVLIAPGTLNRYGATDDNIYWEDALRFTGPVADHLRCSGVIRDGVIRLGLVRKLIPLIEMVQDPSRDAQLKVGFELQKLLMESYFERRAVPGDPVGELIGMLKKDSRRWWSVSEMAELCSLSDDQLRRLFLRRTGMNPKEYVERLKLNGAAEMLAGDPKLKIADAATLFGYADPFHFSRRFRKVLGASPAEYRRSFHPGGM